MSKPTSNGRPAVSGASQRATNPTQPVKGTQQTSVSARPTATHSHSIKAWLGLSAIWIVADQLTKLWIQSKIELGAVVEMTSFFNLVHVLNEGAAFSFLANQSGWQRHFLSAVAVFASAVIIYMMKKSTDRKFAMFCLAGILGGAIGNLIDRVMYGAVVDFLDFYWSYYHWPAFNVADIAISTGAVGLIFEEIFNGSKAAQPKQ